MALEPYSSWTKNRSKKDGGGIATAVGPRYKNSAMGAGEGVEDDEYNINRIETFSPALNIVNCYREQRGWARRRWRPGG